MSRQETCHRAPRLQARPATVDLVNSSSYKQRVTASLFVGAADYIQLGPCRPRMTHSRACPRGAADVSSFQGVVIWSTATLPTRGPSYLLYKNKYPAHFLYKNWVPSNSRCLRHNFYCYTNISATVLRSCGMYKREVQTRAKFFVKEIQLHYTRNNTKSWRMLLCFFLFNNIVIYQMKLKTK